MMCSVQRPEALVDRDFHDRGRGVKRGIDRPDPLRIPAAPHAV